MSTLAFAVASGTFLLGGASVWLLAKYLNRKRLADLTLSVNRTRSVLAARNAELVEATDENVRLELVNDGLKSQNVALMRTFQDLVKPDRVGTCTKVQIQERTTAEAFARKVEAEAWTGPMTVYKCPICPRHPVTAEHIFHITHVDRAQQGKVWDKPLSPTAIRKRMSPQDIADLKSRTGGAA